MLDIIEVTDCDEELYVKDFNKMVDGMSKGYLFCCNCDYSFHPNDAIAKAVKIDESYYCLNCVCARCAAAKIFAEELNDYYCPTCCVGCNEPKVYDEKEDEYHCPNCEPIERTEI